MSAGKTIAIVVAAVAALAVVGVKWRDHRKVKVPGSAALPSELQLPALAALSEGQRGAVQKMAEEICAAINEGRVSDLQKHWDFDGILDRVFMGFTTAGPSVANARSGARHAFQKREGGLLSEAVGGEAQFLRLSDIRGQGGALIRMITKDGALMLAWLMPRANDSRAWAIDVYSVASETFVTENMRDLLIPALGDAMGDTRESRELIEALGRIRSAQERGDLKGVKTACEELPPVVLKRPVVRMMYLQALMGAGDDDAYLRELQRIQQEEPQSVSTSFKLLDLYFMKKDWEKAASAGFQVDAFVGGDAYLKAMAAMCLAWAGKHDEARKVFDEAEAMEPGLDTVVLFRLHLDCARGDYPALVRNLDRLKKEFALDPAPEAFADDFPGFKKFIDSEEYKAWKADQAP